MNIENLTQWTREQLEEPTLQLNALYGDMSSRRYFRATTPSQSWIIVDSSSEPTELSAFIAINNALMKQGLFVPRIISQNSQENCAILQDLGDQTLLKTLTSENYQEWYQNALDDLAKLQRCKEVDNHTVPFYDAVAIKNEFDVFTNWYLSARHGLKLKEHAELLTKTYDRFVQIFSEQPTVFIHRDYHSRNLMVVNDKLAMIDFQGAKWGPITYDAVSLLKDCYIDWPRDYLVQAVQELQPKLWDNLTLPPVSAETFLRWFDLTGLQRHLKVLGQFVRMLLLHNNSNYIGDLPRVQRYVLSVCKAYPELKDLHNLLETLICAR